MSYKAFLVGADSLGLKYSVSGARKLAEILRAFSYEAFLLTPSKAGLTTAFDDFVDSLTQTDTAVLYFSGHAIMEKGRFYLVLGDEISKQSNLLNLNVVLDQFADSRAINKLVILDCCHATKSVSELKVDFSENYIVLASSARLEKSIELDAIKGSFFTIQLCSIIEALHGEILAGSIVTLDVETLTKELLKKTKENNLRSAQVPLPRSLGMSGNFTVVGVQDSAEVVRGLASKAAREKTAIEMEYRELLLRNCDIVSLANLPEQDRHLALRSLELRRLYVPLRFWIDIHSGDEAKDSDWENVESRRQASMGDRSQSHSKKTERSAIGPRLANARRLVVLGDPGAGKTTLIRWLATAYLLRSKNNQAWLELPDVKTLPDLDWIPIVIRCRDLDKTCISGTLDDILAHILRKAETSPAHIERIQAILRERIVDGSALLMLDGLDEISDPKARAGFCAQLERIHFAHPRTPMIVTSRIVGYREMGTRLGRGFEHLTLADLAPEEKNDFVERWCKLTEPPERAADAARSLIGDVHSSDRIERMTGNPLLLTTMALVKRKVGKLPNRRADLYCEAVQVLLNWRNDLGHAVDVHEALPQLEYIAHAMCFRGVQRLRRSEVLELIGQMRAAHPNLHQVRTHSPEEFLKLMEANTGLIVESGRERIGGVEELVYEFRHLTFQEFLAACALVNGRFQGRIQSMSLGESVAPLAARTAELAFTKNGDKEVAVAENWREVLRLVATICRDEELDKFLRAVLNPLPEESTSSGRARAILAVLCIADEPNASEEVVCEIFKRFVIHIDSRDRNLEIRTGAHVAASAIARTRWSKMLIGTLAKEFIRLGPLTRDYTGDIAGLVVAHDALSRGGQISEWWKEQASTLTLGSEHDAIISALGVASLAITSRTVELPAGIIDALILRLNGTGPMAHAAAQALSNFNWAGDNEAWHPSTDQLKIFLSYVGKKTSDPEAVRFLIQIPGFENLVQAYKNLILWADHASVDLRRGIVSALGHFRSKEATRAIVLFAQDDAATVREAALIELGAMPGKDAQRILRSALRDPDPAVRATAIAGMQREGNESAVPDLIACLSDEVINVRGSAVHLLGRMKSKRAVQPLMRILSDEDLDIRLAAIVALGKIASKDTVSTLIGLASDTQSQIRAVAATALGESKSTRCIDSLIKMLKDSSDEVQCNAAHALAVFGGERPVSSLISNLSILDDHRRSNIISALASMRVRISFDSLTKLLVEGDLGQQCGAAELIGQFTMIEATPILIQKLQSENAQLRRSAIIGLSNLEGKAAETALLGVFEKGGDEIHLAIEGLGRIRSKKIVKNLLELAQDKHPEHSISAIEALGRIATPAAEKILRKLLLSPNRVIRCCAVEALSFSEDELVQEILSQDLDGGWPYYDPAKIITVHFVRQIASALKITTEELISIYESIQTKFRLRLAWHE